MWITISIIFIIVAATVLFHFEALSLMTRHMFRLQKLRRFSVLIGVIGAITAHTVEIILFGFGYYWMSVLPAQGYLSGNFDGTLTTCIYFSFTNFTTLGYGDIEAFGNLRFLAAVESLIGLVLITWSASFMFLEMQKFWRK